jgi:hypothetical protein
VQFGALLWLYSLGVGAAVLLLTPVIAVLISDPSERPPTQIAVGAVMSVAGGVGFLPLLALVVDRRHRRRTV